MAEEPTIDLPDEDDEPLSIDLPSIDDQPLEPISQEDAREAITLLSDVMDAFSNRITSRGYKLEGDPIVVKKHIAHLFGPMMADAYERIRLLYFRNAAKLKESDHDGKQNDA